MARQGESFPGRARWARLLCFSPTSMTGMRGGREGIHVRVDRFGTRLWRARPMTPETGKSERVFASTGDVRRWRQRSADRFVLNEKSA